MKNSTIGKYLGRGISTLLTLVLIATVAMGQNLVIGGTPTFSGTGTINVKGNIINTGVASATSITGIVTLNGAAAQSIGGGTGAINFLTLNVTPSVAAITTLNVASTVSTAVNIGTVGTAATLAVGANSLTIGGTSALVNGSSALTTAPGSTVTFNSTAADQVVLGGFTYNGVLTLSGGGTKTLSAATATTVGQAFDASAAGLLTVSGGGLTLTTTGTFAAVTNSAAIKNGSGLMQFGAVTNNSGGTIDGTNAGGAVTFGSTVANSGGTITGGAGLVTFSGLLTQTATGILTSGAGGLTLTAGLTNTLGNITLDAGQSMAISGGQFAYTAGTLSFNATSTVTYGASATAIVDAPYGNLVLNNDPKTWTLAAARTISGDLTLGAGGATTIGGAYDLNVAGNISLASNLTKSANAVVFANASSALSGASEIVGAVTRNHTFTASPAVYTFNRAEVTLGVTNEDPLNVTLTNNATTSPSSGSGLGSKYVNRQYKIAGANFTTNNATLKLYYIDANLTTTTNENRLVFKKFGGGAWTSLTGGGSYTRNVGTDPNDITLASINENFTSETELAMILSGFVTIASNAWNDVATWEGGDIPTATDDATIATTHTVTVPVASTIANLSIEATGNLAVDGANFNATSINNAGGIDISATRVLTVTGGDLTNAGSITNAGTITVE